MTISVLHGSNLNILPTLTSNSIDAIVTDPPYELGFMGKKWDASGIAYSVELWSECLRVLKPGGHLLAFGGTRTYHRMVCAIEDSGFEIRDSIHWIYGSGFPKSLNVSKAIDKAAGAEREVIGTGTSGKILRANGQNERPYQQDQDRITHNITAPSTDEAKRWEGWGTALKPAHEPIVVARKPLDGTVADNVLTHGVGGLNIDATRIGYVEGEVDFDRKQRQQHSSGSVDGAFGAASLIGTEIPTYNPGGRWPANVVFAHTAECRQIGVVEDSFGGGAKASGGFVQGYEDGDGFVGRDIQIPVWQCSPDCPVTELNQQSGSVGAKGPASGPTYSGPSKSGSMEGAFRGLGDTPPTFYGDEGGASRFFMCVSPDQNDIVVARKPLEGTVVDNVLTHGTGALNIDDCRVPRQTDDVSSAGHRTATFGSQDTQSGGDGSGGWVQDDGGRWPANLIHDGSTEIIEQLENAARFFYCAKPSKVERNAGLDGMPEKRPDERTTSGMGTFAEKGIAEQSNFHPTVKPLALMRYLCRLVTPPDGLILDPFAGSGTTLVAAVQEGFHAIGIEMNDEYLPLIEARVAWAEKQPQSLF